MANTKDLLKKRRVCWIRFSKYEKTVVRQYSETEVLIQGNESIEPIELFTLVTMAAMTELSRVYNELQEVQVQLDFNPENNERLQHTRAEVKNKEENNKEKYRQAHIDIGANARESVAKENESTKSVWLGRT